VLGAATARVSQEAIPISHQNWPLFGLSMASSQKAMNLFFIPSHSKLFIALNDNALRKQTG
jgi:hypothetical protein